MIIAYGTVDEVIKALCGDEPMFWNEDKTTGWSACPALAYTAFLVLRRLMESA